MNTAPKILFLANSAEPEHLYIGAANSFTLDADGWLTIPYGDWPHSGKDALKPVQPGEPPPQPVIQRFTRDDAIAIVNDFRSTWSRFKRAIVGLPIFKGHPDAPRFANIWKDKVPRGSIADMRVGDTGLQVKPILTEQGAKDVDAGDSDVSPYWPLRKMGEENGAIVARPFKLFSLGLVPEGNMQGLSLINAAVPHNESETMNPLLIQLLAALGIQLAANASEDDAKQAINQALSKITSTQTDLATANAKVTNLEGQVSTLSSEKAALTTRATSAESNFRTERQAHALALVNAAIAGGRVAAASREAEVLALANATDFNAAATALNARAKIIKTAGVVGQLSQAAVASQEKQQQVIGLVNAAMELPEIKALPAEKRYDAAFNKVRNDPAKAALFEQKS